MLEALERSLGPLGLGWAAAAAVMALLWNVQRRTHDATAVDVAWAASLGALALALALTGDGLPARRALVGGTVSLAMGRLAWYLLRDRVGRGEDGRYRELRQRWGSRAQPKFFAVYQFQALLVALLAWPFWLACADPRPLGALDGAALVLWFLAFCGESLADRQLARFKGKQTQRGRTCREGLWRYSRHPNYFFQWCLWCAWALFALGAPLGGLGLLSPLAMLLLILFVTGIPPSEAQALRSRGDDYREYQRTTSAFVPWFPRRTVAQ
jgi:steroid 5-alpha reductase family enzyme